MHQQWSRVWGCCSIYFMRHQEAFTGASFLQGAAWMQKTLIFPRLVYLERWWWEMWSTVGSVFAKIAVPRQQLCDCHSKLQRIWLSCVWHVSAEFRPDGGDNSDILTIQDLWFLKPCRPGSMLPDFGVAIWAGCEKLQGFAQSLGFFGHLGGVSSCVHSNTFASKTRIPPWNTSNFKVLH